MGEFAIGGVNKLFRKDYKYVVVDNILYVKLKNKYIRVGRYKEGDVRREDVVIVVDDISKHLKRLIKKYRITYFGKKFFVTENKNIKYIVVEVSNYKSKEELLKLLKRGIFFVSIKELISVYADENMKKFFYNDFNKNTSENRINDEENFVKIGVCGYYRIYKGGVIKYDMNSGYAWCMISRKFSIKHLGEIKVNKQDEYDVKNFIEKNFNTFNFIIECSVNKNDNIVRLYRKYVAGNFGDGVVRIGKYDYLLLKNSIKRIYRVRVYECVEGKEIFNNFIGKLYKLKQNDDELKFLWKWLLVSAYGVIGQNLTQWGICETNDEGTEGFLNIKNIIEVYISKYKIFSKRSGYYINTNKLFVGEVIEYMRYTMLNIIKNIKKEDIVYVDTDGIILTNEYDDIFNINNNLGGWKKERGYVEVYGLKRYKLNDEVIGKIGEREERSEWYRRLFEEREKLKKFYGESMELEDSKIIRYKKISLKTLEDIIIKGRRHERR